MATTISDTSKLCIHTITTKPLPIEQAITAYSNRGVAGITIWENALDGYSPRAVKQQITNEGMEVVSLCRGGFFPSTSAEKRQQALDSNRRSLDMAAEVGAPLLVLVCGADPDQTLEISRQQIADSIEALIPYAQSLGVKLDIEPLHPMYADTRSAINTVKQANDLCDNLGSPMVGVVVDVYHIWWKPDLQAEIQRCGEAGRLFAFHVCDWRVPTTDLLNDRGVMGEGCIPIKQIRGWVEEAGFSGFNEVEIFSNHYWKTDQGLFLDRIVEAYRHHV